MEFLTVPAFTFATTLFLLQRSPHVEGVSDIVTLSPPIYSYQDYIIEESDEPPSPAPHPPPPPPKIQYLLVNVPEEDHVMDGKMKIASLLTS